MEELFARLERAGPVPPELRQKLQQILKSMSIPRNGYLLKAGQVSRNVYFITKGFLRGFYGEGDDSISTWFLRPGDIVYGMESFYDQIPSNESIQAMKATEVLFITREEFEELSNTFPEFVLIERNLLRYYYRVNRQHNFSILMKTAEERFQTAVETIPELFNEVPAKFIASYLRISRFTLSRIRRKQSQGKQKG